MMSKAEIRIINVLSMAARKIEKRIEEYDPDKQQRKFCKTSGECLLNELVIELYALDDDKNTDLCSYIYNLFNEIPYYEVLYAGGYKFDENDVTGYIESLIARKTLKDFN